jgi:hypothetical protein
MPSHAIMLIRIPFLSGYAKVRHYVVSLPLIPSLIEPGGRYTLPPPVDAPPPVRPPGGARSSRPRGPSFRTMVADWRATGEPNAFRARLERRLRRAGLIRPRRDDDDAFDRLLDAGGNGKGASDRSAGGAAAPSSRSSRRALSS